MRKKPLDEGLRWLSQAEEDLRLPERSTGRVSGPGLYQAARGAVTLAREAVEYVRQGLNAEIDPVQPS